MAEIFILIVDDKPQNLFALEAILKSVPATIIRATSGDEALALTLNYDFALAILDVQMPKMDGYELASYLLDDPSTARIPIIFLSAAYSDEQHTFKGYEKGAVDYIVKPFEPSILLSKVKVFLELARYRIELEQLVNDRTAALKEEERKLRSIFENTPDYIFNIDQTGDISFINAPPNYGHLLGTSIFDLIDQNEFDQQQNAINAVFLRQEKTALESSLTLPWLPASIPCAFRLSPILVQQKVVSCLLIARDITDSKLAELARIEKLRAEAENTAKSKFLAGMSHEIRTPMNAILGYTQLLKREQNLTDKQNRYLEVIESSGEHLLALIDSVLDMARIESGRMILSPSKFSLVELILDITRMFQLAANKKGLELSFTPSATTPRWIFADPNKIRQVIINLVGNAIKFTTIGSIRVTSGLCDALSDQSRLFINVQDSGCGISPEKIQAIFEPFIQVDNSNSQIGVGLGLAVSREIARLMGGSLTAESQLEQGSTFRFEFPAAITEEPLVADVTKECYSVTDSGISQVLVVDDDQDNLNLIGNILASTGLNVLLADNGNEALRLFKEFNPGLVILDYQMQPVSGLEVAENIRHHEGHNETPIVMITASPFEENRTQSLKAGASAFLAKPFRSKDLFNVIQQVSNIQFKQHKQDIPKLNSLPPMDLSRIDPSELPAALAQSLRKAIRTGYLDEISQTIAKIENTHASIGQALKALAENYQYTKILALLEDIEKPHAD